MNKSASNTKNVKCDHVYTVLIEVGTLIEEQPAISSTWVLIDYVMLTCHVWKTFRP